MALSHRMAFALAVGSVSAEFAVCHHCDNPPCCNPGHLFLGSLAANNADRDRKGHQRTPRGERNGSSKLTNVQRAEIRQRYGTGGVTQRQLAREYGISQPGIRKVLVQ